MTRRFRFDKLVTDEVVANSLREPHTLEINYHALGGRALKRELVRKLIEEAREIPIQDEADDDVYDELADAQNVLDELIARYGLSREQVSQRQQQRREKKGSFSNGYYVDDVLLRDDSPWISYFENDAARYREVKDDAHHVSPGVYQHFKGNHYEVLDLAVHTESGESLVLYRPLYPSDVSVYVRPMAMFLEVVDTEGTSVPRFTKVSE